MRFKTNAIGKVLLTAALLSALPLLRLLSLVDPSPSATAASAPSTADNPNPPSSPVKLVFLHHSVGDDLLNTGMGDMGNELGANNYYVSDTYYDWGPDDIGSATDIGNWWDWFRGPNSASYTAAAYHTSNRHAEYTRPMDDPGGENRVVMFKSCYPNSHMGGSPGDSPTGDPNPLRGEDSGSDYHTVGNAKGIYNDILEYFATRQDKLFVAFTAPPLVQRETDAAHAANARAFNDWLVNDWLDDYPHCNVAVFDLYNVLTSNGGRRDAHDVGSEAGNHHRWWNGAVQHIQTVANDFSAYGSVWGNDPEDSHPTAAGHQKASAEFVELLNVFYHRWQQCAGAPTSTPTRAPSTPTPTSTRKVSTATPTATRPPSASMGPYLPLILRGYRAPAAPTPSPTVTRTPSTGGCPSYSPGFTLVTGTDLYSAPSLAEPAPGQWFTEPVFGTCGARVTDRDHHLSPGDPSTGMVNEYARVQSFNSDGTRLLARGTDGSWYLYDAHSLLPMGEQPLADEPRWAADDPDVIYYTEETSLLSYNVQTAQQTRIRDFADDFPGQSIVAVWTRHEGRPSRDGRYWGLMAQDQQWDTVAFLVYDRHTDQVTIRDMRGVPGMQDGIDHVTISPLGTYFLASFDRYCEHGQLGTDAAPCGLMVYNSDLSQGRSLLRIIGHYDPALDANGREVILYQDIDTDHISMLDLASGIVTPLWEIDFSQVGVGFHFSGLSYDRPGWAVVSTHTDDPMSRTWMDNQVFLVELKSAGRVVRLAHTHSLVDENQPSEYYYWAEPHATTNSDLTRLLFTSNWGRYNTAAVDMHMIALPPDWPQRLQAVAGH
jgi:hypothetical protein